jgi:SNF2 family DNA or RNA helicase
VGDLLTICDAEPESGASAKLDDIVDRLVALGSRNEKSVVFSYRIHPLDLLMSRLEGRGVGCERLVGSMPLADRELALARFRTEERISVLCASSRVAAEGLTLTEANHVFFINRWWNPSNNEQARDRVVRIGQTRPVSVHAYLSEKTIEMNLERILATKRELVEDVVDALAKREIIPTEELAAALFEDLED